MTKPHAPTQYEVETFGGRYVDCRNPRVETIDLGDIAHALSMTCRYGGHCSEFYSVAEHAVYVSERTRRRGCNALTQLAALHHDDSEYVLGDIPRPAKPLFGKAYAKLSDRMDVAICVALGLGKLGLTSDAFHHPVVKDADNWLLFVEAKHLLPSRGINWSGSQLEDWGVRQDGLPSRIVTPDYWRGGVAPGVAKDMFLARHHDLMEELT